MTLSTGVQLGLVMLGIAAAVYGVYLRNIVVLLYGVGVVVQHGSLLFGERGPIPLPVIVLGAAATALVGYQLCNPFVLALGVYSAISKIPAVVTPFFNELLSLTVFLLLYGLCSK